MSSTRNATRKGHPMDAREQRGLVIAATCRLNRTEDGTWLVPSQSQAEAIYRVSLETKSVTFTEKKVYAQDWSAYNAAQAIEKRRLQVLLHDLCRNLPERERPATRPGPKPHLVSDCVF